MELITKRTRKEFQEYFVGTTLREIERDFENYDISFVELPENKMPSGQRRGLVENYYASIDWSKPSDIKKILNVFTDVLIRLNETKNENGSTIGTPKITKNGMTNLFVH